MSPIVITKVRQLRNPQPILWLGGGSLAMVIFCLYSSSHIASDWTQSYCWNTLYQATEFLAMPHKQEKPVCQKISATTSPLTLGCITFQVVAPMIIMSVAWLSKRPTKPCAIPKMNWKQGFTNLNKETIGKAYWRSQSHLESVVETSGDFFE